MNAIQRLFARAISLAVISQMIVIPAHASQRLISADANSTALIVALGLKEQLVAIDVTSEQPEGIAKLPNIGYHRTLAAEGLLALQPDLIIGSDVMGPEITLQTLSAAGVKLLTLPSAQSLDGLRNNIQSLAAATGQQQQAAAVIQRIDNREQKLQEQALSNKRIAFLLTMEGSKLRMAGADTGGDALIQLMGAHNAAEFGNYRNVSGESLLAIDPDIILVAGRNPSTAIETLLAGQPALQHTRGRLLAVNSNAIIAGVSEAAIDEAMRLIAQIEATP